MKDNFTVKTSTSKISKINTTPAHCLTFFTQPDTLSPVDDFYNGMLLSGNNQAMSNCFPRQFFLFRGAESIRDTDPGHALCHQTLTDRHIIHNHLIKANNEIFTTKELQCILNNLIQEQEKNNLCKDGKSNCLLSHQDYDIILTEYNKYYEKQGNNKDIDTKPKNTSFPYSISKWEPIYILSSSIAYAFTATFLRKYIRPFLITQGYSHAAKIIEPVCSSVMLLLTPLPVAITDFILCAAIKLMLKKYGVTQNLQDTILVKFSSALTLWPYVPNMLKSTNFLEKAFHGMVLNQCGTEIGESVAHFIIQRLPKLKQEPPVNNVNKPSEANQDDEGVVLQNSTNSTTRYRNSPST